MTDIIFDVVNQLARQINNKEYLNSLTDKQLATLSSVFNQMGHRLWKHRWSDTRNARHKRQIEGK